MFIGERLREGHGMFIMHTHSFKTQTLAFSAAGSLIISSTTVLLPEHELINPQEPSELGENFTEKETEAKKVK